MIVVYQRLSPNTHRSYKDLEKSLLLGLHRFLTENSASTILLLATVQVGYKCLTLCCHILMVAMVKACYMCVTSDTIHLLCQRYCVQWGIQEQHEGPLTVYRYKISDITSLNYAQVFYSAFGTHTAKLWIIIPVVEVNVYSSDPQQDFVN